MRRDSNIKEEMIISDGLKDLLDLLLMEAVKEDLGKLIDQGEINGMAKEQSFE